MRERFEVPTCGLARQLLGATEAKLVAQRGDQLFGVRNPGAQPVGYRNTIGRRSESAKFRRSVSPFGVPPSATEIRSHDHPAERAARRERQRALRHPTRFHGRRHQFFHRRHSQ